ncbi:MAG: C25 family cysteine peptidase [bacterium]
MKRIIDSGWLNLKLRSQVFIITVIISIILGYTVSYAVSGSIEFNPTQKTAFKLIKSDEQSIIISFQSSVTTIKTGLPYHTYIAVPLQGQPQVNITNYLCQVWNQDSIIQTYRNDTTQTTITELAQIAKLDDPECVRDLRVARLTVKPIFDSAGNKKIFTELTIEIKPAIMSNTTVEYIPTIDTMVRNIGLDKVLKDLVINYDKSLLFRGVPMLPTSKRETYPGSIISKLRAENQAWATVTASQAGLYKIRLSALNQIGNKFDGFISRPVHVYLMDKEVPVWTDNQNVILYNIPPDSVYTNTNIYWITEDDNTGISIPVREIDPLIPEPGTRVSRIQDTVRLEEKRLFDETVINPIAGNDHWFWKLLKVRKPAEIELPLYGLDTNTSNINPADTTYSLCSIAINVYGKSEPTGGDDHHLKIMLNNQVLDELRWSGKTEKQYSRLIPGSMLTVGLNTIQLEVPGDTSAVENDEIYLNYVQITYPKTLITHNGYLIFRADQITGKDTAVAEITLEPQYTDYTVWMIDTGNKAIELAVPSNQNRILIPVIPGNPTPKYIISSLASIESAEPIPYQVQDDLRNSNQQADYLIITHPLFMPIAEKLAAYRRNQGLTVRIVNIESIYPQFSYGMFDPRAIKSFLQYTFYYWQKPAPNYVLLIGDASSDYLGNFANGVMNYVPAYRKYIIAGDCASDSWYTEVSGPDTIPDMLIGRFSVNNMTDAESIFNKIIRYEQSPNYGSWRSRILFMADDGFEENCQEVAQKSIPDTYISREIDLRNYGLEDNFFLPTSVKSKISVECNQVLMDAISQGDLMTIYFGHGSPNVWAHERILFGGDSRNSDMKRLTNVDQLTFVVNLTCSTGGFDYPQKPWNICISEDMHRVPNGGAIALYCPSGLGFTPQHQSLTEFLTKSIFTDQQRILGNAIGQMEIEYAFEKKNDLMPDMFILFGDPAMELAVPKSSFSMLAIPDTVPTKKKNA